MGYLKKAVFGTAIVFIFSLFAAFFGYLFRLILARNLTVEEYGLFYAVFALVSLLWIFKDLGMGEALVKYIPEFKIKEEHSSIKNALITSLFIQVLSATILALILILLSDYLAENYFHNPNAAIVITIFAIYILAKPFMITCARAFQAFQNMKYFASIDLTRSILAVLFVLFGFIFIKDIIVPSLAYLITVLILALIFIPLFIKKSFPQFFEVKFSFDKELTKKLLKFGVQVMIGSAGWFIISYTDTLLLTFFTTMDQVGLYNAALPTSNVLQYFSIALAYVLLPMTSEMWAKKQKLQLVNGIKLLYKYSFLIIIPFSLMMFSFSSEVLNLLFGSKYVGASMTLQILVFGIIFYVVAGINFSVLSGIGKPNITSKIILSAAGINILLNLILIPVFGIVGAAIASASGFLFMLILSIIYLVKNIPLSVPLLAWTKIIISGLIFVGIISYLKKILVMGSLTEATIVGCVAGTVYIYLSFLFKVISFNEVKRVFKNLRIKEDF